MTEQIGSALADMQEFRDSYQRRGYHSYADRASRCVTVMEALIAHYEQTKPTQDPTIYD